MDDRDGPPWRLPGAAKGEDIGPRPGRPAPAAVKARLRRIASGAPEAMVKLAGRSTGGAAGLLRHLAYITRDGALAAETDDGRRVFGSAALERLGADWLLANAAEARGRLHPAASDSVALVLSMPPGTPPDRLEAAARGWARETFAGRHDWLMVRHDDTDHPHVHLTLRAVGRDGLRLAPDRQELRRWREGFARALRRQGIEAEATPRLIRGRQRPGRPDADRESARPDRSAAQAVHAAVLAQAHVLDRGDEDDRRLAGELRRFAAALPQAPAEFARSTAARPAAAQPALAPPAPDWPDRQPSRRGPLR